jgi:membrane protease YdiL (CAAX protease family)
MIYVGMQRHRASDGAFQSCAFARARLLRIYPPLIAAIAITLLVYAVIHFLGLHGSDSYRLGGELFVARERATFECPTLASTILNVWGRTKRSAPSKHEWAALDPQL